MSRQISGERQAAYYVGSVLIVIGLLIFISGFIAIATQFGNQSMDSAEATGSSVAFCWIGGFILIGIGVFIQRIGERGAAGSGVILDPEQAREDLEPYSRQAGGMVKDALDEADIDLGTRERETVVKVRCRSCETLNDEDAKFCKECGASL